MRYCRGETGDVKVNQKLTLNAGVRYDLMTPVFDADNKLSNFDPSTNKIITARPQLDVGNYQLLLR